MDFYPIAILEEFLDSLDRLLDHVIFGVVPECLRRQIIVVAKEFAKDDKFDAMKLFDIFVVGAPSLDRRVHAELYYQFTGFAEVV